MSASTETHLFIRWKSEQDSLGSGRVNDAITENQAAAKFAFISTLHL